MGMQQFNSHNWLIIEYEVLCNIHDSKIASSNFCHDSIISYLFLKHVLHNDILCRKTIASDLYAPLGYYHTFSIRCQMRLYSALQGVRSVFAIILLPTQLVSPGAPSQLSKRELKAIQLIGSGYT